MLTTSSRPTSRITRLAGCVAAACLALLAISSAPALAASTCEGQTFSQPFEALGDFNYYTLVPGAQFNGPSEGWRSPTPVPGSSRGWPECAVRPAGPPQNPLASCPNWAARAKKPAT